MNPPYHLIPNALIIVITSQIKGIMGLKYGSILGFHNQKGFSKLNDSMENWNEIDEEKSLTTWRIEAEWMELRLEYSDEKGWEERCVG